jgi:hypothetical protein
MRKLFKSVGHPVSRSRIVVHSLASASLLVTGILVVGFAQMGGEPVSSTTHPDLGCSQPTITYVAYQGHVTTTAKPKTVTKTLYKTKTKTLTKTAYRTKTKTVCLTTTETGPGTITTTTTTITADAPTSVITSTTTETATVTGNTVTETVTETVSGSLAN